MTFPGPKKHDLPMALYERLFYGPLCIVEQRFYMDKLHETKEYTTAHALKRDQRETNSPLDILALQISSRHVRKQLFE